MEEYRHYLESLGRSPNTIETYLLAVEGYRKWYRDSFGLELTLLYRPNILDYKSYLIHIRKLLIPHADGAGGSAATMNGS